ncbi:MAG: DNA cytosine methyltransferase [Hymenobacteraceae bacterium]|nr:DNA cytosine methyltransferase [Hymenobacteraceae bacterium]
MRLRLHPPKDGAGVTRNLGYVVSHQLVNAADFGVPQKRERVFIIGYRRDLDLTWQPLRPTHSQEALLWSKWVTGQYWDEHELTANQRPVLTPAQRNLIPALRSRYGMFGPDTARWRTVRDALRGLPDPTTSAAASWPNHEYRTGAIAYPGHTGSELDEPAKTIKAGAHGVPGGENMMRLPTGEVRYFTVRESARILTFPDDYFLTGTWGEAMRQLGNAVPVQLAAQTNSTLAGCFWGKFLVLCRMDLPITEKKQKLTSGAMLRGSRIGWASAWATASSTSRGCFTRAEAI